MTGWRLGFGIMNEALAKHMAALANNSSSCVAPFIQKAGIAALGPQTEVHAMIAEFRKRRDVVVNGLNAIPGVHCPMPPGAFYAFPRIDGTGLTSGQLADRLLDEAGVACPVRRLRRRARATSGSQLRELDPTRKGRAPHQEIPRQRARPDERSTPPFTPPSPG